MDGSRLACGQNGWISAVFLAPLPAVVGSMLALYRPWHATLYLLGHAAMTPLYISVYMSLYRHRSGYSPAATDGGPRLQIFTNVHGQSWLFLGTGEGFGGMSAVANCSVSPKAANYR